MLIKISLENFKSFENSTEFSMIASSKIKSNAEHCIQIQGMKLLSRAVVFGANASGKTNLVDFFRLLVTVLDSGLPAWSAGFFCLNKEENRERNSTFEIQFSVNDRFYAYGFSAVLSERRITGEWLYELFPSGSSICIFQRDVSAECQISTGLDLQEHERQRFATYAADFSAAKSSLFLAEMNRNKQYADDSGFRVFVEAYSWLHEHLHVYMPGSELNAFRYYCSADSLALLTRIIRTFDTGITDISVEEVDSFEFSKMVPSSVYSRVMADLQRRLENSGSSHVRVSMRSDSCFFNIDAVAGCEPKITTISLKHGRSFFNFAFESESEGTKRLFDLMDLLLTDAEDVVFVVDELDRSMHPRLTMHFLEIFSEIHRGKSVQLIFTCHDSSLMNLNFFRRDEINFAERDADNRSSLYSLDRFREYYDAELSRKYLEGRFGAVPVFSCSIQEMPED